ncbi:riboflavin synthase [candidate division KSB1 bacterium]|nr:riboflavin synthase [candidate division KSB1 bacterium]
MFTGLIQQVGRVQGIRPVGRGRRIAVQASLICRDAALGDSIAVNGVCLTVVDLQPPVFTVEAVEESLLRTTVGDLQVGDAVNLEPSLRADGRLGGHFVQGHVDGVGMLMAHERRDPGYWLRIRLQPEWFRFCVEKGSIALDGVSLTIAELSNDAIGIALIPHTAESTTLGGKSAGARLNVEVDILGKYIHRFIQPPSAAAGGIDPSKLAEWGYQP